MCDLYNRLSSLCNQMGVSGAKMCRDCGISKSLMSDLKFGRRDTIASDTANRLAKYFGVTVDYILNGEKEKKPTISEDDELTKYIEMLRTRPEMRLLLDTQDGATKEQVEENVRFLDALRQAKNAD